MTINVSVCSIFLGGNLGENEVINKPPFRLIMDILRFYIWSSKLEKALADTYSRKVAETGCGYIQQWQLRAAK